MRILPLVIVLAACEEHGNTPGIDADITTPTCADDSAFEPNDTIQTAFVTPLHASGTFTAQNLAICPSADFDIYAVDIGLAGHLSAAVTWSDGPEMRFTILDPSGAALMNGVTTGAVTSACLSNLPAGNIFVRVFADADKTNNYRLSLSVPFECP